MSINNHSNFNFLKTGAQAANAKNVQNNAKEEQQETQKLLNQPTPENPDTSHQLVAENDIWTFLSTSAVNNNVQLNKALATGATMASMGQTNTNLSSISVKTKENSCTISNGKISFEVDSSNKTITKSGSNIRIQNKLTGAVQSVSFQDAVNKLNVTKMTCKNGNVVDFNCGEFKGAKVSYSSKDLEWKISMVDSNQTTSWYSLDVATGATELISLITKDGTVLYTTQQPEEKPTTFQLSDYIITSPSGKEYYIGEPTDGSFIKSMNYYPGYSASIEDEMLVLTKTTNGFTETYKYDTNDVKRSYSKIEDATGRGSENIWGPDGKHIQQIVYSENQNLNNAATNNRSNTSTYVDEDNNTIEYTYDSNNEPVSGKITSSQGVVLEEWLYDGYKESHQTVVDTERNFVYGASGTPTPCIKYNSTGKVQSLMYYKDDKHLMSADGNLLKVSLPYSTGLDCYIMLTDEQLSNMSLDKMVSFYSDIQKITRNICSSHRASVQLGQAKNYKDEIFAKVNEYFSSYFNNEHCVIMTGNHEYRAVNRNSTYSNATLMFENGETLPISSSYYDPKSICINDDGSVTCTKTVKNKVQNRVETQVYNTKGLIENIFDDKYKIIQKQYDDNGNLTSELNLSRQKYPYIANIKTHTNDKEKAYNDFIKMYNTLNTSLSNLDWKMTINGSKVEIDPKNYDSPEQLAIACGFEVNPTTINGTTMTFSKTGVKLDLVKEQLDEYQYTINNDGSVTFTYQDNKYLDTVKFDANGNLIEESYTTLKNNKVESTVYEYDANNKLAKEVTISNGKVQGEKTYFDGKDNGYYQTTPGAFVLKRSDGMQVTFHAMNQVFVGDYNFRYLFTDAKSKITQDLLNKLGDYAKQLEAQGLTKNAINTKLEAGFKNLLNGKEANYTESTTRTASSAANTTNAQAANSAATAVRTTETKPKAAITQNGKVFTNANNKTFDYSKISPINNGYTPTVNGNKLTFTKTIGNMTYTYELNENFEFTKYVTSNKVGETNEYTYTNGSNINGVKTLTKTTNKNGVVTFEHTRLGDNTKEFYNVRHSSDGKLTYGRVTNEKGIDAGYVDYAAKSVRLNINGVQKTFKPLSNISQTGKELTADILAQLADFAKTNTNTTAINNKLNELLNPPQTTVKSTTQATATTTFSATTIKATGTKAADEEQDSPTFTTTTKTISVESPNATGKASATRTTTKDQNGNLVEEKTVASNGVVVDSMTILNNNPLEQYFTARDFVTGKLEEVALSTPEGKSAINVHYDSSTIIFYVNGQPFKFTNTSAIRGNSKDPDAAKLKELYQKVADLIGTKNPQQISSNVRSKIGSLVNTFFKSLVQTNQNPPAPATITITPYSTGGSGINRNVLK